MSLKEQKRNPGQLVFGLDIGTRSIVGTVGYRLDETFHVVAQHVREHETRAMLDGQIHDIDKIGRSILEVKQKLEMSIGRELNEVCIAAAGRVLRTITTQTEMEFDEETAVEAEHIYNLEMLGMEKAYSDFLETNDNPEIKFYCVGYTVVRYTLNDTVMTTLEKHKAKKIGVELIATFLPDDVVDGLYKAVEIAGLQVANLTLEPIAAMTAAVPLKFRSLNIALVDVGAGTSDISVTKEGSIIAYGMIPKAGDELTEAVANALLLDFNEAERVKVEASRSDSVTYTDIMDLEHTVSSEELCAITLPTAKSIAKDVSDKIKELNGNKPVSAIFVVGGGGKIGGFTEALAEEMGIIGERVALRGEEVLKNIEYKFEGAQKDSLFVTPIGICLNFYDQKNNFIFVNFNDKRIKLYDNGHLTIADAAMQASFPNECLFPRRGEELVFTVNEKQHMVRGEAGEAAVIKLNGHDVNLNSPIQAGDKIKVIESSIGEKAHATIASLIEYGQSISVNVNDKLVELPVFAEVNGQLQSEYYEICSGDDIKMLNYYTVQQIIEFMDVLLKSGMNIYVNNKIASPDTKVYDNFSVIWSMEELHLSEVVDEEEEAEDSDEETETADDYDSLPDADEKTSDDADTSDKVEESDSTDDSSTDEISDSDSKETDESAADSKTDTKSVEKSDSKADENPESTSEPITIAIIANGKPIALTGKSSYMFVDVFDHVDVDLTKPHGKEVVMKLNGEKAKMTQPLSEGDKAEVYWE